MKLTEEEFAGIRARRAPQVEQRSKYGNRKVEFDGHKFDSKRECERYILLRSWEQQGVISNLRLQVPFELNVNGQKICKYIADFTYQRNGRQIVEDVKGEATRILPVYRLKKKLMKAILGIEIMEV